MPPKDSAKDRGEINSSTLFKGEKSDSFNSMQIDKAGSPPSGLKPPSTEDAVTSS